MIEKKTQKTPKRQYHGASLRCRFEIQFPSRFQKVWSSNPSKYKSIHIHLFIPEF